MSSSVLIRGDIQGLRAIAVLLVIFGHTFPKELPGGFIGVDIFFVISGFVITQQLQRLQKDYPEGFLTQFYARRIRRILPSSLLVLVMSYIAVRVTLGLVTSNNLSLDSFWASLFLANVHFQNTGRTYFDAGIAPSTIQHFWSLAVEEQFYLVLPLLFLLCSHLKINRNILIRIIAFVTVSSLAYCIIQSNFRNIPIFFETFPRCFEIGAGVLCAQASFTRKTNHLIQSLLLASLLIPAFTFTSERWPNALAIPIILATSLLLADNQVSQERSILGFRVLVKLGDISFLVYLVHWPILIISQQLVTNLNLFSKLTIILVTLLISLFVHHLYESPLRKSEIFLKNPRMTITLALTLSALSALIFSENYQG